MKYIVVQWEPEEGFYKKAMRVVRSNHPRFSDQSRFDFGFLSIASAEGYTITILPSLETIETCWKDGNLIEKE